MYESCCNINKTREYLLLHISCILDWIAIHRGACPRSWSKKIGDMFNSYATIKNSNFQFDNRITWNYSYKLIGKALDDNNMHILDKVSCVKSRDLNRQLVYAMVNTNHNKIYVGRTNNLLRRLSEHIRAAFKHAQNGTPTERVHAYMSHTKAQNWTLIPIGAVNNILADAKLAESRYIKILHRNRLLNDDFHTRARNSILSKKSKSFKRPDRYTTRRGTKFSMVSNYVPKSFTVSSTVNHNLTEMFSLDFCRVLQHLDTLTGTTLQSTQIKTMGAMNGLTNWKRVRLLFGKSTITFFNKQGNKCNSTVGSALSQIKSGVIQTFCINSVLTTTDDLTKDTLQRVGASKAVAKHICNKATLHDLLSWRGRIHVVDNKKLRNYAACNIETHLKLRFNLRYSKPLTIRVPFSPNLSLSKLRAQAISLIDQMDTEPSFARLLKRRVRVVFTKQPSIEDYVSNHKKFCKNYKHSHPPKCVCKTKGFNNLPKIDGHIAFKATEVSNPLIKKCLHTNAKNIITPTDHSITHDVTTAFDNFISDLTATHAGAFPDNADLQSQVSENLDSFILEDNTKIDSRSSCIPNMHEIAMFKTKYKGLVVSPLDKNSGCMFLCCPCHHDTHLRKTFTENTSYSKSKHQPTVILDRWETFYDKHNYSKWYNYPRRVAGDDSSLPVSYVLPKNKDVKKDRPITSYYKHPFKRVFNAAGRALLHILDKTTETHFNMGNVSDLMEKIEKLNNLKTNKSDSRRSCLCLNGDLANMFTSLDHKSIRKAIRWLLDSVKKSSRRREVSVPMSKSTGGDVHLGRSGDADTKRITLTFEELIEIVEFDLNNTYFRVGDTVLQQKVGIPMGSPLSPAIAQILCAYYESHIISKCRLDGILNQVEGIRYVDDLTAVIYYDPTSVSSTRDANDLAHRIQFGYHPQMVLEVENTDLPFKFLSSVLEVDKLTCTFDARFHNKNQAQIKCRKPQQFPTYQHFHSFAPTRQKKSVVISSIHRIGNACNSMCSVQNAFNSLCVELRQLCYPARIIRDALWRVQQRDSRWQVIDLLPMFAPASAKKQNSRRPRPTLDSWPSKRPTVLAPA